MIRFDSFIQWNQTDPAALSFLTHLVPLVPSLQLIWLKPSVPKFPCPQFNHSNHYCTTFSIFIGTTNSNSFINSIDAINLIVFISSIPTVRSISFNFDSILDITDCYHSYRCRLTQQNFSEKSGKIYTTGKHFSQLVVMTVATILTCDSTYLFFSILLHCILLVQTALLNLSVIPFLSLDLSIWLIPFSHNFHAIIPWIPSVPSITQFQFYQFQWL